MRTVRIILIAVFYLTISFVALSQEFTTDYWGDEITEAQDAYLTVDGISITSSSNTVTDAVPGVTLSLIAANGTYSSSTVSGTAGSIRLTTDTSLAKTKIKAFVTAYNDAMTLMDEVTTPKSTLETYGAKRLTGIFNQL